MTNEQKQIIETACEAYSELYATYEREALINLLNELYPTYNGEATPIILGIRKQLKEVYNIK